MMIVVWLLVFCLRFCTGDQHKIILYGEGLMLFITQVMLATSQGEVMKDDVVVGSSIGVFVALLVLVVGAL